MSETKDKYGEDEYIIFMELASGIEGKDFIDDIAEGRIVISPEDKQKVAVNLLNAVREIHKKGIYHRDLKWKNVFIDPSDDFQIKILDFGMGTDKKKPEMSRKSPPTYVAPESQGDPGSVKVDGVKLDVYSVGVMLTDIYKENKQKENPFLRDFEGFTSRWGSESFEEKKRMIDDKIEMLELDDSVKRLIPMMIDIDPDKRLSLDDVISYFENNRPLS